MKQTAVEWLMCQMLEASINKETKEMHIKLPKDAFQQAKAMEKEQIVEAYRIGVEEDVYERPLRTGEQYYTETFKSE